jgi:hypothetical protein
MQNYLIVFKIIYVVFTLRLKSDNSLWWVTGLPLGSPVVGLPHLATWTGGFCSISSAEDGTVISERNIHITKHSKTFWNGNITRKI